MVTIRLSRSGNKKCPFYQIIVTDNRCPRDGRFIERIGFFNPTSISKEKELRLDLNRIKHWISTGATVSNRVTQLIKQAEKSN
ncbi:30S ribosomal protein S16 [Candidatus Providencia siddallii]|uniref:Small ribosomal subunit protein bS16 n=1 Tax=Candidatus Providencia siddallii TaxID=1715285 RepID=A0A0M6W8E4_9GAMM|nr:30S ribosomal protein S16 [Candidatus Providencia siddallii]